MSLVVVASHPVPGSSRPSTATGRARSDAISINPTTATIAINDGKPRPPTNRAPNDGQASQRFTIITSEKTTVSSTGVYPSAGMTRTGPVPILPKRLASSPGAPTLSPKSTLQPEAMDSTTHTSRGYAISIPRTPSPNPAAPPASDSASSKVSVLDISPRGEPAPSMSSAVVAPAANLNTSAHSAFQPTLSPFQSDSMEIEVVPPSPLSQSSVTTSQQQLAFQPSQPASNSLPTSLPFQRLKPDLMPFSQPNALHASTFSQPHPFSSPFASSYWSASTQLHQTNAFTAPAFTNSHHTQFQQLTTSPSVPQHQPPMADEDFPMGDESTSHMLNPLILPPQNPFISLVQHQEPLAQVTPPPAIQLPSPPYVASTFMPLTVTKAEFVEALREDGGFTEADRRDLLKRATKLENIAAERGLRVTLMLKRGLGMVVSVGLDAHPDLEEQFASMQRMVERRTYDLQIGVKLSPMNDTAPQLPSQPVGLPFQAALHFNQGLHVMLPPISGSPPPSLNFNPSLLVTSTAGKPSLQFPELAPEIAGQTSFSHGTVEDVQRIKTRISEYGGRQNAPPWNPVQPILHVSWGDANRHLEARSLLSKPVLLRVIPRNGSRNTSPECSMTHPDYARGVNVILQALAQRPPSKDQLPSHASTPSLRNDSHTVYRRSLPAAGKSRRTRSRSRSRRSSFGYSHRSLVQAF